jgi:two-component system, response regulator PdtaR
MTKSTHAKRAILIVENHQVLRHFMVGLVETAGFEAIQVSNADEALLILECRSDIALLVTNVVMDGSMDGVELAHAVDIRWPAVKIIVVSGQRGLSESDLPRKSLFLAKPYHDEEMVFEIRSLIGP